MTSLLRFSLGEQRYALELNDVRKVFRAVAVTPLPQAPDVILGVVNVRGRVLPVANLRLRLGLPPRQMQLEDRLIWAAAGDLDVLLPVDQVDTVTDVAVVEPVDPVVMQRQPPLVKGVQRLADGLLLIQDLNGLLNLREREALDHALTQI